MTYKGIEIGEKPTLAMIEEFIKEHPSLGFVTDAKGIFFEGEKRKWKTSTYKPIKKLESFITGINGALQQRTRWEKTRSRNKAKREKDEKKRNEEKTKHKSSDYSKLLQDPRWQKKRLEIMQRDNFTCQMCGNGLTSGVPLNVHHYVYHKGYLPWEYPDKDLITLCRDCHHKLHEEKLKTTTK